MSGTIFVALLARLRSSDARRPPVDLSEQRAVGLHREDWAGKSRDDDDPVLVFHERLLRLRPQRQLLVAALVCDDEPRRRTLYSLHALCEVADGVRHITCPHRRL